VKIAIVTPWFSENVSGGAEKFAGGIATCLKNAGLDVEILTTCGRDSFWDWGTDYYPEGVQEISNLTVRRFPLRKRNKKLYEELLGKLLSGQELNYLEEMQLLNETVNSDKMYDFIQHYGSEYLYLFIPYLFGTTYWGSRIRPSQSYIIPCIHDENMAYFHSMGHLFTRVQGLLFNTIEERELANKIHPSLIGDNVISGGGVEVLYEPNEERFRQKYNIKDDYFIYVGRQVTGKNVPQIIDYFTRFISEKPQSTKLVFIGNGEEQVIEAMKKCPNIIHLGEVPDEDKFDALQGAIALIQPSLMESFSIVIMESWLCDTPVIVNEYCHVTKGHCVRSDGGLFYRDYSTFMETIEKYLFDIEFRRDKAVKGKEYVEKYYTWEAVAHRITDFLKKNEYWSEDVIHENIN